MSWNSRSRLNFAHALNKFTHTHIHTEVMTVFLPLSGRSPWPVELLSEFPGSGSSSPSIQWDRTWLSTDFPGVVFTKSRRDCQISWSISPWSPSWVKTAQRVGALEWRRTRNTIGWHATSFGPVSLFTPMQPSFQPVAQGPSRLESHWGLQDVVEVWSEKKPSNTWRSGELRLYFFTPAGSDVYLCLSTEQRIHKIFKR
jgi:hypothetical protein